MIPSLTGPLVSLSLSLFYVPLCPNPLTSRRPPTPRLRINSEDYNPDEAAAAVVVPVGDLKQTPQFTGQEEELRIIADSLGGETQDISDV